MASPQYVDECISSFMAEIVPDNDPKDVPSAAEIEAISHFLAGKIDPSRAAFLYTRDTVKEQTSGDIWDLIYHIAQHLPETQDQLIELVRAISTLPSESRISGETQLWNDSLGHLRNDLRDHWDDEVHSIRDGSSTAQPKAFVNCTIFAARLRFEGLLGADCFSQVVMFFALEFDDLPVQVLETFLLAAAAYLRWVARDVYIEGQKTNCYPSPLQTARDFGETGHWDLWKSRMAALGHEESLHEDVRNAVKASLRLMTETEGAVSK
ncbi:MAG: hypothetical protein Q9183_002918 [Haloplaca sp. 2 TL-2023]